ncbi:MAG TPA: hypothetical protein PLP27_04595 [Crocinitomicaceae bacterium]|nr:hypothetical protein [Crocinitomicaceae bacterium]
MKTLTTLFVCIVLTLFSSCNQRQKQENVVTKSVDTLTTITEKLPVNEEEKTFRYDVDDLPDELLEFIPTNYSILNNTSGDLNLDGINDCILVLKKNGEDTLSDVTENPERRPLLILLRDKNNKLKLAKRNDNTVLCVDCGGVLGDPFMGITIKNGYFSVEHYGGSAWRWTYIVTYKYSKEDNEWLLHKAGGDSYHTSEPNKVESSVRTTKDFGKVKFETFDIYEE